MDGTQGNLAAHESITERRGMTVLRGTALEGFGALATIALAIVGLVGMISSTMAAIATIIVGAATLVEGGAFGLAGTQGSAGDLQDRWFASGVSADLQGGLAALVLGILALLGIAPQTLLSVAVLALGATFLLSRRVLMGIGAIVLGILAVVGLTPQTLVLVGLLVLGAGLLLSGSETLGRTVAARS